jgi:murein DD-endopeptidase MepM/ murein hydrolase activator NlpD
VLVGAAALAVLLAVPVVAAWEASLEGTGHTGAAASGGDLPVISSPSPWPAASPEPVPTLAAVDVTPPVAPDPGAATALVADVSTVRSAMVPNRAWIEWTGTRAPSLDRLNGYRWPLAHPRLTLPFGPTFWGSRLVDGEPFHDGVDLATFCNDRVMAAHSGTVLAAGRHYDDLMGWVGDLAPYYNRLDRGHLWSELPNVVVIDDGNGYRSMYAHMWKLTVKVGDKVRAGQLIGYEGMTGRATGCHLHYGLFSPWEMTTFRIKPDVARRMKLPPKEIARVDPLLVLPPRAGINAPKKPKTDQAASSPSPAAEP